MLPALTLVSACSTTSKQLAQADYPVVPITPALIRAQNLEEKSDVQAKKRKADQGKSEEKPATLYSYKIAPGDIMSFILWDAADPNNRGYDTSEQRIRIKIEADGSAAFPYAGIINVAGMTIAQARENVEKNLGKYFHNPRFDLQIEEFHGNYVMISGAVAKPGVQYLGYEPLTLSKAIEKTGGALDVADLSAVTWIHADGKRESIDVAALLYEGDVSQDRVLENGDTLLFNENHRNRVFVMGEALRTGIVTIKAGKLSLTEALNDSQSPNKDSQGPNNITSIIGYVYVIRGAVTPEEELVTDDAEIILPDAARAVHAESDFPIDEQVDRNKITIYQMDPSLPVTYVVADQFMLKPRDIVYVAASAVTEWRRFISQILPGNFNAVRSFN